MIYSGAGCFSNGMAAFESNGVWGYIDSNGKTVLPFGFNAVKGYSAFGGEDTPYECFDGYVTVTKDGKFGIYSSEGKAVTQMIYDWATPVVSGRAYICNDGKWGLASFGDSSDASARTEAATTTKRKQRLKSRPRKQPKKPLPTKQQRQREREIIQSTRTDLNSERMQVRRTTSFLNSARVRFLKSTVCPTAGVIHIMTVMRAGSALIILTRSKKCFNVLIN